MTQIAAPEMEIEPTHPNPPHFWWTKRILAGLVVLIIMLSAIVAAWRYESRRLLLADLQAYRDKVTPIIHSAVSNQPVPDQLNAANIIQAAVQSLVISFADRNLFSRFDAAGPLDALTKANLERIIATNPTAIQLTRLARFQPNASWGKLGINTSGLLNLTNLLKGQSLLNLMSGNQVSSVETALDMVRLGDLMYQNMPATYPSYYGSMMVAASAQSSAAISLQLQVLPDADSTTQPTGLPSKAQIHTLIKALLDDTYQRQTFEPGLLSIGLQFGENAINRRANYYGSISNKLRQWFNAPIVEMDARRQIRQFETFLHAVQANDYQAAVTATSWPQARSVTPGITPRPPIVVSNWSQMRFYESHLQALGERRAAAVQLAIRLYVLDHQGQFPKALTELVPDYLPNIPADPFTADGRPFMYVTSPTPLLYSVGRDGQDNQGLSSSSLSSQRWFQPDGVFSLTAPAPSTSPANSGN